MAPTGGPVEGPDSDEIVDLDVEHLDQSDEHGRIPFEERHPRVQARIDNMSHRWLRLQRHRWIRFVGTFMILYTQRRGFGLSAEAAFWATFTLPWLFLGGVSAVANVAQFAGRNIDLELEERILEAASLVLTDEAVEQYVEPLLQQVVKGSAGLTAIGLIAALWSGSRVFATFVEGSVLINGSPKRNYLETRGLALTIYALGLAGLGVLVFTVTKWPEIWSAALGLLPGGVSVWLLITGLFLMAVAGTTMMWLANPRRLSWWYALPGGLVGLVLWVAGSMGLQAYMSWLLREGSLYGAIAAPIAIILWIFVGTMAMFIGITLNATILLFRDVAKHHRESLEDRRDTALLTGQRLYQMASHPGRTLAADGITPAPGGVDGGGDRGGEVTRPVAGDKVTPGRDLVEPGAKGETGPRAGPGPPDEPGSADETGPATETPATDTPATDTPAADSPADDSTGPK